MFYKFVKSVNLEMRQVTEDIFIREVLILVNTKIFSTMNMDGVKINISLMRE